MSIKPLINQARKAAETWSECDEALAQCADAFGQPFEDAREKLNTSLLKADHNECDLTQFQGPESPFRFPDLGALVIVRISKVPTPVKQLETVEARIERIERELKLAKNERKRLLERLTINGHQFVTEKVTTSFKRISK